MSLNTLAGAHITQTQLEGDKVADESKPKGIGKIVDTVKSKLSSHSGNDNGTHDEISEDKPTDRDELDKVPAEKHTGGVNAQPVGAEAAGEEGTSGIGSMSTRAA